MKIGAKTKQFLCFIPPKRKLNDFRKLFKKSTEESWGSLWFGCSKVLFSRDHHWRLWIRTGIFTVFPINFTGILMEKCLKCRDSALPILSFVLIWFTQVNQTVIEFDSNVMDLSSYIIHWSIRFVFCSYVAKPTNFNWTIHKKVNKRVKTQRVSFMIGGLQLVLSILNWFLRHLAAIRSSKWN